MLKPAGSDAVRWQTVGRDGSSRSRFCLRVATSAWCVDFDVVLVTHVLDKSVRACERFTAIYENRRQVDTGQRNKWGGGVHTGELASYEFLTRMGSEVGDKCGARRLREATTRARGPFTGVLGFVLANVICRGLRKFNVRVAPARGRNEEARLGE
jgi:hypothetical protein